MHLHRHSIIRAARLVSPPCLGARCIHVKLCLVLLWCPRTHINLGLDGPFRLIGVLTPVHGVCLQVAGERTLEQTEIELLRTLCENLEAQIITLREAQVTELKSGKVRCIM